MLTEEGLENSWARHKRCVTLLYDGLKDLGLKPLVTDLAIRLPILTTIEIPQDLLDSWQDVCRHAMNTYKVEIAGGLGSGHGKLLRIGTMGNNATPETVRLVLKALGEGLEKVRNDKREAKL